MMMILQDVTQCCLCECIHTRCVVYWILEHEPYGGKLTTALGMYAKPGALVARHHAPLSHRGITGLMSM